MKAQYLGIDAIISGVIFLVVVVSIFSFLSFFVYSSQLYSKGIDSVTAYVSYLLLSENSDYSIIDPTAEGKRIDPSLLASQASSLSDRIPYPLRVDIDCEGRVTSFTSANAEWVSHLRRASLSSNGNFCTIDIYLGIPSQ